MAAHQMQSSRSNTLAHTALVEPIMAIMEAAFDPLWGEAWTRRQVSDALALPTTHALLIDESGATNASEPDEAPEQSTGFVLSRHVAGEEELLLIAITPAARGKGLGRKLIEKFIENAKSRGTERIFLEMRANNPAETLYRSIGFETIGRRRNYYTMSNGNRLDALTFALPI
jgi:ribosomal-protein-alanine N-acetyltransferase